MQKAQQHPASEELILLAAALFRKSENVWLETCILVVSVYVRIFMLQVFKMCVLGGTWVAQSVECPTWAQDRISQFVGSSPASGSVLMAQSLEPLQILCLPLSLPLPRSFSFSLSLSLSKTINIKKFKKGAPRWLSWLSVQLRLRS